MAAQMKRIVSTLYRQHWYLMESDRLKDAEKKKFMAYFEEKVTDEECMDPLLVLSGYMRSHFGKPVIILEFKIFDPKREASIEETAERALRQIEDKKYETMLRAKGIKNVRK